MNQPASKEPTMDEILSSIRQIIADDDDRPAPKEQAAKPAAPESRRDGAPAAEPVIDPFGEDEDDAIAPLALSPDQIVGGGDAARDEDPAPAPEMPSAPSLEAAAELVVPDDVAFAQDEDVAPEPRPEPVSVARSAPMPDPGLGADLAEELLEPATKAAVRDAFSKLNTPRLTPDMPLGAGGLTVEAMIRDMLRPMLKDWLEENLPSMVERIVAQEIERVSRGGS